MSDDQDGCEWVCFFWYRPTRIVPEQRPLNGCVCVLIIPFLRELTYSSDPLDGSNDAASLKVCPWSFR